jgi:purine nucleoside permease
MAWRLDPRLVGWAYGLTKSVPLADNAQLAAARARFTSEPASQGPPRVLVGASLASVRFWHGERRTQWARDWVKTWTDGQGVLTMTAGEEQAILDVLTIAGQEGRVDSRRILVLRTASNYSREGDGEPQMIEFAPGGGEAGFEAAWRVGAPVVKALVAGWTTYATTLPGAPR